MANPWIKYIDRSAEQILTSIKARIKDPVDGIPEITDLSDGNDFIKLSKIWSGISEMIGYWIDKKARETFLALMKRYKSGYHKSIGYDYRIRGAIASFGEVTFEINEISGTDITIPKGTVLKGSDGTLFMTNQVVIIPAGETEVTVGIRQKEKRTKTDYESTELKDQKVVLDGNVFDNSITVDVAGIKYAAVNSFTKAIYGPVASSGYFQITGGTEDAGTNQITQVSIDGVNLMDNPVDFTTDETTTAGLVVAEINGSASDPNFIAVQNGAIVVIFSEDKNGDANGNEIIVTVGGDVTVGNKLDMSGGTDASGTLAFVAGLNVDGNMEVRFGDGINGAIPGTGLMTIEYYVCNGKSGNVPSNFITEIVDEITVPQGISISVNNEAETVGGRDKEGLEDIKRNLPLLIRTKERAVTDQDYIDIAKLAPGVHNADVNFECGKGVDLYILPYGGGIAFQSLLDSTKAWFEQNRSIKLISLFVKPVGEVRLKFNVVLYIKQGYSASATAAEVESSLLDLLGWRNAKIKSNLVIGDLYQKIEESNGVENSYITNVSITPYAEPVTPNVKQLEWSRELVNPGLEIVEWKIIMVDGTNFNLYRNNEYDGYYQVGVEVEKDELNFTLNAGTYAINDSWIFRTYPLIDLNQGKINLVEYSIITSKTGDITITTEGGI